MANLVFKNPFRELANIEDMFEKMLERMFDWSPLHKSFLSRLGEERLWSPAIEIQDKKDHIVVKAELPGVDKKDIKISIENDVLSIKGETRKEQEEKTKEHYYSEITYGKFYRTIPLPVPVQEKKAKATYKDGILTITLPKKEPTETKGVEIEIE